MHYVADDLRLSALRGIQLLNKSQTSASGMWRGLLWCLQLTLVTGTTHHAHLCMLHANTFAYEEATTLHSSRRYSTADWSTHFSLTVLARVTKYAPVMHFKRSKCSTFSVRIPNQGMVTYNVGILLSHSPLHRLMLFQFVWVITHHTSMHPSTCICWGLPVHFIKTSSKGSVVLNINRSCPLYSRPKRCRTFAPSGFVFSLPLYPLFRQQRHSAVNNHL